MSDRRKGFTLVEISVVLVIIGLLIGGILVAQSMIAAAKLIDFASQMQQYDAAITNFRTTYRYYPGDAPTLSPPGNGDNIVHAGGGDDRFASETQNVWKHLSDSGFIKQSYTNVAFRGKPGLDVPEAKYGGGKDIGVYVTSYYDDLGGFTSSDISKVFFYVCYTDPISTFGMCGDQTYTPLEKSFFPSEALAFDAKVDDGLPVSGNVRAGSDRQDQVGYTSNCVTSAKYKIANTTIRACALAIRYGYQTGEQ